MWVNTKNMTPKEYAAFVGKKSYPAGQEKEQSAAEEKSPAGFSPGQTVWFKSPGRTGILSLTFTIYSIAPDGLTELMGPKGECVVCFTEVLTAIDPNKPTEPVPQACPFCGEIGQYLVILQRVVCPAVTTCYFSGPQKPSRLEAIEAWQSIHVYRQGPIGTMKFSAGIEAIDDIHSLHEHCFQKAGMPNEPIGCPGTPGSIRNQIIRFIDKLAADARKDAP